MPVRKVLLESVAATASTPYPSRVRAKTQLYQSDQVEASEREKKKEGKEPRQESLLVANDRERTSHNWMDGARIGEAQNPGPLALQNVSNQQLQKSSATGCVRKCVWQRGSLGT